MTLEADIAAALPALQAEAESRMTDVVKITRPNESPGALDPITGLYPDPVTIVYHGRARLKLSSTVVSDVNDQAQLLASQSVRLDVPMGAGTAGIRVNDTVLVLSSQRNPGLAGLHLNIEGLFFQTEATARRLAVEVR